MAARSTQQLIEVIWVDPGETFVAYSNVIHVGIGISL